MYGFYDNVTLLSYVPKQSKFVLSMNTMHKLEVNPEDIWETSNGNGGVDTQATNTVTEIPDEKSEIIQYYNRTKGGVDTLDQLCATYTSERSKRRWPLCIFYSGLPPFTRSSSGQKKYIRVPPLRFFSNSVEIFFGPPFEIFLYFS
jgi:hypothetical protein